MPTSLALAIGVLVLWLLLLLGSAWSRGRHGELRVASAGAMLLLAGFCAYGFIASGEYSGQRELLWKVGYAIIGGAGVASAILLLKGSK